MMSYATIVLSILASLGGISAFCPQMASTMRPSSSLYAERSRDVDIWGAVLAPVVAGLIFTTQASVAAESNYVPLNTESASTVIAVDTMDFSLPTYGDAVGGKIKDNLKAPPGFNPFGDLDFTRKEEVVVDKEEKKVDESPKMPSISLPKVEMPKMESKPSPPALDSVEMPKIELPKVDMPKVEMPKVDIPKVDMPDMPKVSLPKFSMPKMDAPKLDMPAYNLDIPKVDVPKVDIPKVDIPKVDLPKVNLPNPFSGGGGGSTVDNDLNLESRDIRDERARVARKDFLGADDDVKDAEEKLQALKRIRQSKKETASAAKDLACADRPGGKFFCLRNPFSAGF